MNKYFSEKISKNYPSQDTLDEILDSYLPQFDSQILKAMRYSLLGGGKRMRLRLALASGEFFGVLNDDCVRLAAAVEMIHTYSLIHDDLPCMDNDDFRRGKPSCHKQFGEHTALLAGNGLLNQAASILAGSAGKRQGYAKAARYVLDCAGISGMLIGQEYDLNHSKDAKTIAYYKTGKLFTASVMCGGLYADADEEKLKLLEDYGKNFGLAFQLFDDFADNQSAGWAPDVNSTKTMLTEYVANCYEICRDLGYKKGYFLDVLKYFEV